MVAAENIEQRKDTEATISCAVSGLSAALTEDTIKWTDKDDVELTTGDGTGLTIDIGIYSDSEGTQTTTLTVSDQHTDTDKIYKCFITPPEATEISQIVNLKVYGKFSL